MLNFPAYSIKALTSALVRPNSALKRTITIDDDTGATSYTNANLVTDFAGEPSSFLAELCDVSGSYESTTRTLTITKR